MAEAVLWNELKDRKLGGFKFVRQFPIGPYFADFACRGSRLVVEIDGSQHADSQADRMRDEFMRSQGFSVIRFWNTDVLKSARSVCETILAALDGRLSENVVAADLRFVVAAKPLGGQRLSETYSPSPARCARHLSPTSWERGTAAAKSAPFLSPKAPAS